MRSEYVAALLDSLQAVYRQGQVGLQRAAVNSMVRHIKDNTVAVAL